MTKSRWWMVVLVALAAVVIALVVYQGRDDDPDAAAADPTPTASRPSTEPTTPSTPWTPPSAPTATPTPGKPVGLDDEAPLKDGSTVSIEKVKPVTSTAKGPGEIEGPAIQVTLAIDAGSKPVDLSTIAVNAFYGPDQTPAITASGPGGEPFTGTIKAGGERRGVYIFNVPANARDDVVIEVFTEASEAPVRFRGEI